MRFASLGSGSRGNATVVEADGTCLLIDCGFSMAQVRRRLARLGRSPADLAGILLTHEHGDHVGGVARLAGTCRIPVWLTEGTRIGARLDGALDLRPFTPHEPIVVEGLDVRPVPVPHDAREPCQFVFSDGDHRLGVLTDAGSITTHMHHCLTGCDALLIECNHDLEMLAAGPYPSSLKQRVGSTHGHLSNTQAAALLAALDTDRYRHVVAMHLSETNNRPALARQALARVLNCTEDWIQVADQDAGLGWRAL